ncbi:F0F1 ATP synthase subunit A [Comamonas faecalis]|uniref:ATP synthase subunit a n=1 Tax=Comamonas faecalis TaxID=1387849 RepID=A0ABP7RFA7_9BURK
MELTPDATIVLDLGWLRLNATIVNTWIVMAVLTGLSWLVTRSLDPNKPPGRWRNALEVLVQLIEGQIADVAHRGVRPVMYFAGTLFLFIAASNTLSVIPGFKSPTGSLSTTAALTLAVLLAVPLFGVAHGGARQYLHKFIEPSILILPFNVIGELSKAVSLSIRLYGNVMSGAVIAAILLGVAPFFFPVVMDLFGLLVGLIQAYIFAILAAVYISAAMAESSPAPHPNKPMEDTL